MAKGYIKVVIYIQHINLFKNKTTTNINSL